MKITVVIDVYNAAAYIKSAIESVLAQSRFPDEIILVDDGSIDETVEIVNHLLEAVSVARVICKENGGQLSCISKGITEAKGDLIALLDGDDLWKPNHLAEAEAAFVKHPQLVQYACNYEVLGKANESLRDEPAYLYEDTFAVTALSEAFIGNVTSALVYKASAIKLYLPLPAFIEKDWVINADNVLIWLASLTGRQKLSSSRCNIVYRFHDENMHHTSKEKRSKAWKRLATKRLFEFFKREFYISSDIHSCLIREYKAHSEPPVALRKSYLKAALSNRGAQSRGRRLIIYLRILSGL